MSSGHNGNGIPFGDPRHPLSGKEARAKRKDDRPNKVIRRLKVEKAIDTFEGAIMDDKIDKDELAELALVTLQTILKDSDDNKLKAGVAKTSLEFTKSKPTAFSESKVEVKQEPTSDELLDEFEDTIEEARKGLNVVNNDNPEVKH